MSIVILNPVKGGQSYTTAARARSFIRRDIAVMTDDGCLLFLPDNPAARRTRTSKRDNMLALDVVFWNGQPKHKIMQKVNIRRTLDYDCGPVIAMHRPGEVRS